MPRSRSRSIESSTWSTAFLASIVPVKARNRSASVDLPWSMWATIEKFRILARVTTPQSNTRPPAGRPPGPRSAGEPRVVRDDGARLEDDTGPDARAGPDPDVGGHDTPAQHCARTHRHPLPEHGLLDPCPGGDDAAWAEDRPWPYDRAGLDASALADRRWGPDLGAGRQRDRIRHPHAGARLSGRRERRTHPAVEQVHVRLAVRGGAADVAPVGARRPPVARHAVGDEGGEEFTLDRDGTVRRHAVEEFRVEEVDAGVDRVGRDLLVGGELLAEAADAAPSIRLDQTILAWVRHRHEEDRHACAACLVEPAHGAEIGVGQDVPVEHEHVAAREIGGVADAAAGAERLFLDHVA